jgi:2-methylisocitrate lyase-like PEP mutase family enzyme
VSHAGRLRREIDAQDLIPFIGVYDVFSASVAAQHYDALFVSGFGFAASHYGLPDVGFIAWPDIVDFVRRVRTVLPTHHILVDIDDGYCDIEVACHVVSMLEKEGASGVVLEDQRRPRRCGHFDGKQLLELDEYLEKLRRVLATRRDLVVVARTDAAEPNEVARRIHAFADAGADAVLVDGVKDLDVIRRLSSEIDCPLVFNQIAGGRSAPCTATQLRDAGVSLIIYSTPCLFAAQEAMEAAMLHLMTHDGQLPLSVPGRVGVGECTQILEHNLARRDTTDAYLPGERAIANPGSV